MCENGGSAEGIAKNRAELPARIPRSKVETDFRLGGGLWAGRY